MAHDDDSIQRRFALDQAAEDPDQVTTDGAADAAVVHLEDFLLSIELLFDECIVDTNLAELSTGRRFSKLTTPRAPR